MDLGAIIVGGIMMSFKGLGALVALAILLLVVLTSANVRYSRKPWMSVPADNVRELTIVAWSAVFFLISELFSLISMVLNVMYFEGLFFSFISSLFSASSFALLFYVVFVIVDRVIGAYATKDCCAIPRCKAECPVMEGEKCKLRVTLFIFALFVVFASFYPFLIPLESVPIDAAGKVLPFVSLNNWFDESVVPGLLKNIPTYVPGLVKYEIPLDLFLIEYKLIPGVAFLIALSSVPFIFSCSERFALKMLMLSLGLMIYPYLEIVFYSASRDILKASLAFEFVEFLTMVSLLFGLRCVYPPVEVEFDDEDDEDFNGGEGVGEVEG
ncbi:MAG: hypothetical protein GY804_06440 [Alphaproteobacteria bacterium]|nr:hypothetical protein [Alphaproteobacteria bacterium]